MRSHLVFGLLIAAGVALTVLPPALFGFPFEGGSRLFDLWYSSMTAIAIPLCLIILNLTKGVFVRVLKLIWGLWMTLGTGGILLQIDSLAPTVTPYGTLYLGITLVLGLSLTLFSMIDISNYPIRIVKRDHTETVDPLLTPEPTPPKSEKVEGS